MKIVEYITVTLYGFVIMFLFTKEQKTVQKVIGLAVLYVLSGLLNLYLSFRLDNDILYMLYPLTVHIPLFLYYVLVIKTPFCQALFALTSAYILTTPRKWICELFIFLFGGSDLAFALTEITVSAVLVPPVAKFTAPVIRRIFKSNRKEADYLCILPFLVYLISYATTVYSDVLFSYPMITIPVLTTVLSIFFIGFEVYFFDYTTEITNARHNSEILKLQLKSVEKLARHMGSGEKYFCENKTVNSFLSMYAAAAESKNILFVCSCNFDASLDDSDILVILTSILDGALCSAEKYIKFEALQMKRQICIMAETDGDGMYDSPALAALSSAVENGKGIISTEKKKYKIQISITKGDRDDEKDKFY